MKPRETTDDNTPAHALRAFWYVLCSSEELTEAPLSRQLFGKPIVLFRGPAGAPAALVDRCAHRNVPLSCGRVVHDTLECGYHGWRYDAAGVCQHIPALCGAPQGKGRRVGTYAACERHGFIWVYGEADAAPATPLSLQPYTLPYLFDKNYRRLDYSMRFESSLFATLENILDVPHTAFLHRGLFRGTAAKKRITAHVRRFADRVEAEYVGENAPRGILGRLLAPQGASVFHFERFILRSKGQVQY